ncbi:MAG: glycosyltransferase, partial [Candidatus Binataceae bacterium]
MAAPDAIELSLVIPTYNERENIAPLLEKIAGVLGAYRYELIIADDNSPDRTWERARELASSIPRLRVINRRGRRRGLAPAVLEGFQAARGAMMGVMDADGSHPAAALPAMIAAIRNGAEIAIGSR